jgi:hypothetical protein
LLQQKELLNKELPETWKLAISKNIENKLFSKVPLGTHQTCDANQLFVAFLTLNFIATEVSDLLQCGPSYNLITVEIMMELQTDLYLICSFTKYVS